MRWSKGYHENGVKDWWESWIGKRLSSSYYHCRCAVIDF